MSLKRKTLTIGTINIKLKGGSVPIPSTAKVHCSHCFTPGDPPPNDKVYVIVIDQLTPSQYAVNCYGGRRTIKRLSGYPKGRHTDLDSAEREFDLLCAERTRYKTGYLDVTEPGYKRDVPVGFRTTVDELLTKIDTTRIVGLAAPPTHAPEPVVVKKKSKKPLEIESDDRADRSL